MACKGGGRGGYAKIFFFFFFFFFLFDAVKDEFEHFFLALRDMVHLSTRVSPFLVVSESPRYRNPLDDW